LPAIGVGKALTELGKVYLEQDYRIKSLRAFERSYKIHKEFYGEQGHPEVSAYSHRWFQAWAYTGNAWLSYH